MTFLPKYTITKDILADLTKIEAVKNSFDNQPLSPVLLSSLHKTAKIAQSHYSTQIEGNHLSLKQVETTLYSANNRAKEYQGHDEKEVKAYYEAINYMEKVLENGGEFDEKLVQKIHSLIEGSKKNIPYRNEQNAIYDTSDGSLVPIMMKDLIDWVNDNINTLPTPVVAGLFHYQFVTIHPYFDGNGRTARLMTSYIMRKFGYGLKGIYSLEEYYAKNLKDYYQALATHPHHNYYFGRHEAYLTPWLEYFIKGVATAFTNIEIKAKEKDITGKADVSPILRKLDIKQRKILELFTEFEEVTSIQAGEYLNLSSQSARLLLNRWVEEGFLIIANKARKNRTYGLAQEYEQLIS